VSKLSGIVIGLVLAACGGHGPSPVQPSNTAAGTVQSFMQAVADSNLNKMAALWGTANGPALATRQPPDYQRRIAIMQAYLRSDSFRLASDVPQADPNRRALQVELRRETCTWLVPFVAIKTGKGWLINQVDLSAAGNPARPCQPETGDSTSRS
jgi:hypothetical protein